MLATESSRAQMCVVRDLDSDDEIVKILKGTESKSEFGSESEHSAVDAVFDTESRPSGIEHSAAEPPGSTSQFVAALKAPQAVNNSDSIDEELRIKIDDGCYEIFGADATGRAIEVMVDPATLEVIEMEYED